MKQTVVILILVIIGTTQSTLYNAEARSSRTSSSDVYVEGYTKKDWTVVPSYYKTAPDSSLTNNYSCIDNGRCGGWTADYTWTYTNTYTYTPLVNLCWVNSYAVGSECKCYYGYEWVDKNDPDNRDCKVIVNRLEQSRASLQKNSQCNLKFPGTSYRSSDDSCICPWDVGWSSWNSKSKSCSKDIAVSNSQSWEVMNTKCSKKYPGTVYQSSGDKCVCSNWNEYNAEKKSCENSERVKCTYSNGTRADIGDRSLEDTICQTDWTWACEKWNVWNSEVNACISEWNNSCKVWFWINAIWNFEYSEKWEFMCSCITGYTMLNNKCILDSKVVDEILNS